MGNPFRSASGRVKIRITSADIFGALECLMHQNIPISKMELEDDLTASFFISEAHLSMVEILLHKRGELTKVIGRQGILYKLRPLMQRKVLIAGILTVCILSFFLSTRVLVIVVDGNSTISDDRILECAEDANIRLFVSTRSVRSERVKNKLLTAMPELLWCGVNTYGSKAVISVQEKEPTASEAKKHEVASIVSAADGIVRSVIADQGTAVCSEGESVKKGQILISGYTDCGILIQACKAKGEVYADTEHTVRAVTPMICLQKTESTGTQKKISLRFGKKRINLWKDSGIWDDSCDRIYKEYFVPLPGGYRLPVSLIIETSGTQRTEPEAISESEAEMILMDASQCQLFSGMIAGKILSVEKSMESGAEVSLLTAKYRCNEMIGREHLE